MATHTKTHMRMYTQICVCIHMHMYTYMCICTHTCAYVLDFGSNMLGNCPGETETIIRGRSTAYMCVRCVFVFVFVFVFVCVFVFVFVFVQRMFVFLCLYHVHIRWRFVLVFILHMCKTHVCACVHTPCAYTMTCACLYFAYV